MKMKNQQLFIFQENNALKIKQKHNQNYGEIMKAVSETRINLKDKKSFHIKLLAILKISFLI